MFRAWTINNRRLVCSESRSDQLWRQQFSAYTHFQNLTRNGQSVGRGLEGGEGIGGWEGDGGGGGGGARKGADLC